MISMSFLSDSARKFLKNPRKCLKNHVSERKNHEKPRANVKLSVYLT